MTEMTDILVELDCSLFFSISRIQSGWCLGVLESPMGSVGEMQFSNIVTFE